MYLSLTWSCCFRPLSVCLFLFPFFRSSSVCRCPSAGRNILSRHAPTTFHLTTRPSAVRYLDGVRTCVAGRGGGGHTHIPVRKCNASRVQTRHRPGPRGARYRGSVRRKSGSFGGVGRYGFRMGYSKWKTAVPDLWPLRWDTLAPVRPGAANH